jgi:predicted HicB family RNase H-like nuclease
MPADKSLPWVALATRIPKNVHRAMKLYCVQAETSVMEFVIAALQEKLQRSAPRRAKR